jgi:hypothetical protein
MPNSSSPSQTLLKLTDRKIATLQRVRLISRLLDSAITIPGTKYRFGLDPVIGLIPGIGDVLGTTIGAYIVLEAVSLGLPAATLGRMAINVLLDGLVGTVPILGDWFDFGWKANSKNVALIEAHVNNPHSSRTANRWFLVCLFIGFLLCVIGLISLGVVLAQLLSQAVRI